MQLGKVWWSVEVLGKVWWSVEALENYDSNVKHDVWLPLHPLPAKHCLRAMAQAEAEMTELRQKAWLAQVSTCRCICTDRSGQLGAWKKDCSG